MSKEFMRIFQDELIAGFLSLTDQNKLDLDNTQKILPYGYHLIWGASGKILKLCQEQANGLMKVYKEVKLLRTKNILNE